MFDYLKDLIEWTHARREKFFDAAQLYINLAERDHEPFFYDYNFIDNAAMNFDYKNRKHVYAWCNTPCTLSDASFTTTLLIQSWNYLDFRPGTRITGTPGSSVTFMCTDEVVPESIPTAANGAVLTNIASQYPSGATPIIGSSGNVANAVATATLPNPATRRLAYITGFEVTGAGATAADAVTVTVAGILGGPLAYTYSAVAGVAVENTPLIVSFSPALPASANGVDISVSCPALGAGNTNNTIVAHGYII